MGKEPEKTLSMFEQVLEFHEKFGHPVNVEPDYKLLELRFTLHDEEVKETADELATLADILPNKLSRAYEYRQTKIALTKELCDIMYVVLGTGVSLGLPLEEAFKEVHRSNMSKLEEGKPVLREDGKILKGKDYTPPNLEQFFE